MNNPSDPSEALAITVGEEQFAQYLSAHTLTWKKDQPFGVKKPDYLISPVCGPVLCEVKDFGETDLDRAAIKAGLQTMRPFLTDGDEYTRKVDQKLESLSNIEARAGGAWDPVPRLQELIAEAGKQLRPAKGKLPCAVIVYNTGSIPNERDLILRIAIGKNRLFGPTFNTTISALCVLEEIYPKAEELQGALTAHADSVRSELASTDISSKRLMAEILVRGTTFEERLKVQRPDLYAAELRLRVYYNKYAALQLPRSAFTGAFDEHIEPDKLWDTE